MSAPVKTRERLRRGRARRPGDDLHFVVLREVVHHDVEHEAIELRFGQRIGAFQLDRVLRREDQERPLERVLAAAGGDVVLLHRLEQRRLRLGRRAVDLVGEQHVREDRPPHEAQRADAAGVVEHLGAGDVGRHQVRRELDPLEAQVEDLGQRADQQRLGQAGHAGQQAVAAGEERDQQLIDGVVLADDHLAQLLADPAAAFDDTGDDFLGGRGHGHGLHVAPGSHGRPQWVRE